MHEQKHSSAVHGIAACCIAVLSLSGKSKVLGWDADSLQVGDEITAIGNPDKNLNKHFLYLDDIVTEGGVLWGEIPDAGFTPSTDLRKGGAPRPENLQRIMDDFRRANSGSVSGTFVGTWLPNYGGVPCISINHCTVWASRTSRSCRVY